MKKIYLIVSYILIAGIELIGQEPRHCKKLTDDRGNVVLWSSKGAKGFTKNYFKKFEGGPHTRAVYFSSRTFEFISDFFEENSNYLGLEVWFVIDNKNPIEGDLASRQIDIVYLPVKEMGDPDFEAFEKYRKNSVKWASVSKETIDASILCPGTCDDSYLKEIGKPGENIVTLKTIPVSRIHSVLFNEDNEGKVWRNLHGYLKFKNEAVKESRQKRYTQSIFFDREKFLKIGQFLKSPHFGTAKFPVYAMYWINYKHKCRRPDIKGQIRRNQLSVGFSPMILEKGLVLPDPCSYRAFLDSEEGRSKEKLWMSSGGTDNHGTLCPNGCPPGGN